MCFLKHITNESLEVTTRSAVGSAVRMVVGSTVRRSAIHGWVAGSRRDMLAIMIETLVQGMPKIPTIAGSLSCLHQSHAYDCTRQLGLSVATPSSNAAKRDGWNPRGR
jgi:hypothetical protein